MIYEAEHLDRFHLEKPYLLKSDARYMYVNGNLIDNLKDIKDKVDFVTVRTRKGTDDLYVAVPKVATSTMKINGEGNLTGYSFRNRDNEAIEIVYTPIAAGIYNKKYQKQLAKEAEEAAAAAAAAAVAAPAPAAAAATAVSVKPEANAKVAFAPHAPRRAKGGRRRHRKTKRRHTNRRKSRKARKSRK